MPDPRSISVHLQSEDGIQRIPSDSGGGPLSRPFAVGDRSGYTSTVETLYDYFINDVPDPDEALRIDPGFLQKLYNQPDVAAAMNKRSLTVSQMPWRIEPNELAVDTPLAEKVARYVNWVFSRIPNVEHVVREMEEAVMQGGSGHEWKWHQEADHTERPIACKPIHKTRFCFDRMGNMALRTREQPVWGAYLGTNPSNPDWAKFLPAGKFTYHVHKREPGPWERPDLEGYLYWGKGEDVAVYYPVTFDLFCWRFELKWLEKYGMVPTELYHQDNRPPGEVARIARSLRGESIITIPMGPLGSTTTGDRMSAFYAIKQQQVPSPSFSAFESYYKTRTKTSINNILLGSAEEQDKSSSEGKGGYSDHVSRRDSGPMVFYGWDARNISATITHQIVGPIVDRGPFRGIPESYYPAFRLEAKEEKDQLQQVQILGELAKYAPVRKTSFYERAGEEAPTPEEISAGETVGGEQQQEDPFDQATGGAKPAAGFGQNGKPPGAKDPIGQGKDAGKGSVANTPSPAEVAKK